MRPPRRMNQTHTVQGTLKRPAGWWKKIHTRTSPSRVKRGVKTMDRSIRQTRNRIVEEGGDHRGPALRVRGSISTGEQGRGRSEQVSL